MKQLVECVPNFSEGRDPEIIKAITDAIESVEGIKLLNVDPGKATNRTVVTFVGEPAAVVEAAFRGMNKAAELIDMSSHKGEHPRMGATDVCPLIPVSGISMEETVEWSIKLARKAGDELGIPVYLYEEAQPDKSRSNLSVIRAGEYEGFFSKINEASWKPDFGPVVFSEKHGATVIGARDFLIAYNVNLNTKSVKRANSVAFDIREAGRVSVDATGKKILNTKGEEIRIPGKLKGVKAIGWYIEEYGQAQVSINITKFREAPLHLVFEACNESASQRGMRVTGSELIGLVPLSAMLDAGKYFLGKQRLSTGVSDRELIHIAVKSMGLDELGPFHPDERIIEYLLNEARPSLLVSMKLDEFADLTASESPAPGGGSIAAYAGALGAALAAMVANLSAAKKGWEEKWQSFSDYATEGQRIKKELLHLVDEDTAAFNRIMEAFKLPKTSHDEKAYRKSAIQQATKNAIEVPLKVMEASLQGLHLLYEMASKGNPNSVSDSGVGALCARTAVAGAHLNIKINAAGCDDKEWLKLIMNRAVVIEKEAVSLEATILAKTNEVIESAS